MFDFLAGKKKKRKRFTPGAQKEILLKQNFKCAGCDQKFAEKRRPHCDHIDGESSNNRVSNGQALCPTCHDNKTTKETQERVQKSRKERDDPFNLGNSEI